MVYHYCNLDALIGILTYKVLWASNYKYLNDHEEIDAAKVIILNYLDIIQENIKSSDIKDILISKIKSSAGSVNDYFITSFSKESDVLSQWRAYSENGRGVCIGLNEDLLVKLEYDLCDVFYGKNVFISAIVELANSYSNKTNLKESELKELDFYLTQYIARYKSEAFEEEQEKRVIISGTKNLKFRRSGNFIVPYLEINFKDHLELIEEIWIGPSQKDEDTKKSIQYFKDYLGYQNTRIRASRATFRD